MRPGTSKRFQTLSNPSWLELPHSSDAKLPNIGFLLYPRFTGLDLVGPHEILSRIGKSYLIAVNDGEVKSDLGLFIRPDANFQNCPDLDIFVVPGGPGADDIVKNEKTLSFIREKSEKADTVASICTGALILAAAGCTRGKRVTTHWLARKRLRELGACPVTDRVAIDGKYWSSAGVSAGIDLALELVAQQAGKDKAQLIQLQVEYDPHPPFTSGNPDTAPSHIVEALRKSSRFPQ